MKLKHWGLIVFAITAFIRLWLNFSHELIPGVNGGYYPLQVRAIVENGYLAFSDMPFLFYIDALIVKFLSLIGFSLNNSLILNTVKIIDSFSIPLIVIPLYALLKHNIPTKIQLSILLFATVSFSPLILTSDLEKNALAILFSFFTIQNIFLYTKTPKKSTIILAFVFFGLTLITHFGTFVFLLLYLLITIAFYKREKAIIPLIIISTVSLLIISLFDYHRFERILSIGAVLFEHPALLTGRISPPEILMVLIAWGFSIHSIVLIRRYKQIITKIEYSVVIGSIITLLFLSFPLLDLEYFKRLSLFQFIPEIVLIIIFAPYFTEKLVKIVFLFLISITTLSLLAVAGNQKPTAIDQSAFADLKKMESILPADKSNTIIIARHGLEWWAAWQLRTNIAQDKAIDENLFSKFSHIYIIRQLNGFGEPQDRTPFHEPEVDKSCKRVYLSKYFELFKVPEKLNR
jgi:hypothetical protein